MKKIKLIQFLLFLFILAISQLQALEPIVVDDQFQRLVIGKYLEYYEDKTGELTIEDVSKPEFEKQFIKSNVDKPNFGYTDSVYWIRFQLDSKVSEKKEFLLEHSYPILDNIQFFIFKKDNTWFVKQTGDHFPFGQRDLLNRNFLFKIATIPNQSTTYFMSFKTNGSIQIPLELYEKDKFLEHLNHERFALGIYYGIILVMILYNIILFFSMKDTLYIYYTLYLIGFLFFQMGINGISFEYLWSNFEILNLFINFFMSCIGLFLALFTKKFLNIDSNKILIFIFNSFIYAFIIFGFLSLIPSLYSITAKIIVSLGIIESIFLFILGCYLFFNGYKPARFYLLSFSTLIIGTISYGLKALGIFPSNFFTENTMQIGSALESVFLSLAVADKILFMRKEKEKAQNELIRTQEEAIQNQKMLIQSYARFVPEELLRFLGKDIITKVNLGDAVEKSMTVLFSDIRSFTAISESMTPNESFEFINTYLNKIAPCIRKYNGYIDKFIGDGIMALFPLSPRDAILASIEMLEVLNILNIERLQKGLPRISVGIGIHTGKQMVGVIGEKERLEGTVISDVVNTSSRLEGLTKAYACSLIVSKDVLEYKSDDLLYRQLDTVKVKGKNKSVEIYEILNGNSERIINLKLKTREDFEKGIQYYQKKDFDNAFKFFQKVKEADSKDKACELYIHRCEFYLKNGISPDWDGVEKLDFK